MASGIFRWGVAALLVLQGVAALPSSSAGNGQLYKKETSPAARATDLKISERIISLRKTSGIMPPSSQALSTIRDVAVGTGTINPVWDGGVYVAEVELGNSSYDLIFDSGSSNLWVASSSFQCLEAKSDIRAPLSACGLGKLYNGTFGDGSIADENFNVSYGFGGSVIGTLGYEDVSLAGITIEGQEIALATQGFWAGDNVISGVMGFAYPSLTNGYIGNNPAADTNATNVFNNPFIFNAIAQGKIAPLFSIALQRGPHGGIGQIALGGLPKVNFTHNFASTAIQARDLSPESAATKSFTYYTISPQGYTLNSSLGSCCEANGGNSSEIRISASTNFPVFVDSGSTFIYYPIQIAEQVNGLFQPPAIYNATKSLYQVKCDALPPTLGIKIGGQTFNVNAKDLVLTEGFNAYPTPGMCLSGVQRASGELSTLGDVFLRNVVAVYDIGASQMRFAAHEY